MAFPSRVDEATVRALHAQGLTPTEIAREMGLARSTLVSRLDALGLPRHPDQEAAAPRRTPVAHSGPPARPTGIPADLLPDLQEMLQWWRERRDFLQGRDADSKTQRVTYHVEERWIEAIKRQSDLEGLSLTQVVNRIFHAYFTRKST